MRDFGNRARDPPWTALVTSQETAPGLVRLRAQ